MANNMEIDDDDDAPQDGAVDLLYSFMHPSLSLVSKYKERYELNGLQATAYAPCSIPTNSSSSSSDWHTQQ